MKPPKFIAEHPQLALFALLATATSGRLRFQLRWCDFGFGSAAAQIWRTGGYQTPAATNPGGVVDPG